VEDLRDHLPGVEPERRIADWGRSERAESLVDRTLYEFLYRRWFRVEVDGAANVPAAGGALLVANRAGLVPFDAAMIARAVREEHPHGRPVHVAMTRSFSAVPALGVALTKLGVVGAHPANLRRLLFDEEELVLAFPEGAAGSQRPTRERYRLKEFVHWQFQAAAAGAGAPILPVAVLGGEEAAPVLTRLAGLPVAPPVPLPAKFFIRFLEPVDPRTRAARLRELIQDALLDMLAARPSPWFSRR
jgi:1-acyl-sn-glycerol-3-phosphate acyltransferase